VAVVEALAAGDDWLVPSTSEFLWIELNSLTADPAAGLGERNPLIVGR
jgi:hypothetical protein